MKPRDYRTNAEAGEYRLMADWLVVAYGMHYEHFGDCDQSPVGPGQVCVFDAYGRGNIMWDDPRVIIDYVLAVEENNGTQCRR